MSSFVGHSLTGAVIYFYDHQTSKNSLLWLCWLMFLAIFPDIEYGLLWFFGTSFPIRFTHSFVFCSILPVCTLFSITKYALPNTRKTLTIQAFGAAYSHLFLDMLVGVSPLPLLWPFTKTPGKLPFGILPSAGRLALTNWYLYRNLVIELGILAPLYSFILLKERIQRHQHRALILGAYVVLWLPFLVWGFFLGR